MCPDVFLEWTSRNRPLMPRTQILHALRMLCKVCYHISIVVAFRMDGRKLFECATCGHAFSFFYSKRRGKNLRFQKIYGYMWTASHFGCALAHRRSDSAVSIRLMLNCDMFRFQYWGPYETTMVTACTGSSEKRQTNKIGLTRETTSCTWIALFC